LPPESHKAPTGVSYTISLTINEEIVIPKLAENQDCRDPTAEIQRDWDKDCKELLPVVLRISKG
jgi:hypothetical protein